MMGYYCLKILSCLFLLSYYTTGMSLDTPTNTIQCIPKERQALIQFKHGIEVDYCGLLASWDDREDSQSDCCMWRGVHCDNQTRHVIKLQLPGGSEHFGYYHCLEGKISPSILELNHLKHLDLSFNSLYGQIPSFIGSLINLQYLNLSSNSFNGKIPPQLANLSSLTSLDLSGNYGLYAKNLGWLSSLTLLRDINFSNVNLSQAIDWMQVIHKLPFLRVLHMSSCGLSQPLVYMNISSSLSVLDLSVNNFSDSSVFKWVFNLTKMGARLVYLDLSGNGIHGTIPDAISSLEHLQYLDLSYNNFQGNVPKSIGDVCSLQTLQLQENNLNEELSSIIESLSGCAQKSLMSSDLSGNMMIWGSIPDEISSLSSLRELKLGSNNLNGSISPSLGQLSMLQILELDSNSLKGTITENHLFNLSRLIELDVSDNPDLVINISSKWIPPFQLRGVEMSSCKLGPYFPSWLLNMNTVSLLDISNSGISESLPLSFWSIFSPNLIYYVNVSHNNIFGVIPNSSVTSKHDPVTSFDYIDFSSNHIEGTIPSFLTNFINLFLQDNMFSNSLELLCPKMKVLTNYLDLSNNLLSGQLPDCWKDFESLSVLRLANNRFTGKLPTSFGNLKLMKELFIRNNSFVGELPRSLENWTSLVILDLAYNSFVGNVPLVGIGNLKSLALLNLRSNNFDGALTSSICQLSYLQILDLSSNHIFGTIPKCIHNLTAMLNPKQLRSVFLPSWNVTGFSDSAMVMWKGEDQIFTNTLGLVKYIAISDNHLQGQIPSEISLLTGLDSLDLARNNLTGTIPSNIGQLTSLQVLDLSSNHLSGEIPTSLATVSYLEILDLSNNDLSGRIPLGTQLQGFDPSVYAGNPRLCGPPLPDCLGDMPPIGSPKTNDITKEEAWSERREILLGVYISAVLGFIVGFWGVCGSLVLKRSWRHAFFRFMYDIRDKVYVIVVLHVARIWRRP